MSVTHLERLPCITTGRPACGQQLTVEDEITSSTIMGDCIPCLRARQDEAIRLAKDACRTAAQCSERVKAVIENEERQ